MTYAVVAELAHHVLLLLLPDVDHVVAGVDAIPVVIEGYLASLTGDVAALEVLEQPLAYRGFRK